MIVKFHKIENMVSRPGRLFNLQMVRHDCDVSFSSSVVAGDAFLRIYEPLRGRKCPDVILNRDVAVQLFVEGETEVTDLESTDALPESIRALGPRGHFEIIAHLLNHSRSSKFRNTTGPELSCLRFLLWAGKFPPGSLEIAPGPQEKREIAGGKLRACSISKFTTSRSGSEGVR